MVLKVLYNNSLNFFFKHFFYYKVFFSQKNSGNNCNDYTGLYVELIHIYILYIYSRINILYSFYNYWQNIYYSFFNYVCMHEFYI